MNYPNFNIIGDESSVPVANIGDNRMLQGIGYPLRPVQQGGGDTPYAGPGLVLTAQSGSDQIPTGLGVPMQVEFGPAQGTPSDPVQIDDNGVLTINETGVYAVTTNMYFLRTSNNGEAIIMFRGLVDGTQFGNPLAILMDDGDTSQFQQFVITGSLPAGSLITFEVIRDSDGANDGQLESITSADGWGTAPSALIRVLKY